MKNRDLMDEITYLRADNIKLKTDNEVRQSEEIDEQIRSLLKQVTKYKKDADENKTKYLDALRQARDIQIDYEAKLRSGNSFEIELENLRRVQ